MKAKRKRHSAAFKAKVGFEALVGLKTVSQLAREYAVHPTQVTQWRATIRDHMPELFEPGQPGHGGPGAVDCPVASEDWSTDGGPGLA